MPSPANQNAAGQIQISGGTNPFLQEKKENTTITRDPFQELLFSLIAGNLSTTPPNVSPTTTAALENFTKNPAVAANFFPDLARPLLAALRPAEDQEVTQLTDLFRKAGGTGGSAIQSGAFAQAARQLVGDQANRRQQVLAQNYVPLTNQLSENTTNAIRLGLNLPEANSAVLRSIVPLAGSISPLSTQIEQIQGGTKAEAAGGLAGGSNSSAFLNRAPMLTPSGYQYPQYNKDGNIVGYSPY